MPQRQNLDDTGRCRNDDNPLMQKRLSSADISRHRRRKRRSSAALEVVLRGQQDLLPHADRILVRLAGLGLVVGDRR